MYTFWLHFFLSFGAMDEDFHVMLTLRLLCGDQAIASLNSEHSHQAES